MSNWPAVRSRPGMHMAAAPCIKGVIMHRLRLNRARHLRMANQGITIEGVMNKGEFYF
jgi:hypothetical protein